jgi:signal peptidase I
MSVSTEPKKRRAWLAALLSLLLPGLGQLYNRQVRLALALIILSLLLAAPLLWLIAALPAGAVVPVSAGMWLLAFPYLLCAIVQPAIRAWRVRAVSLAWFNRWYIYIGLIVFGVIWQTVLELIPVPSLDAFNSPSGSMSPTLVEGDYYQTRTLAFVGRLPERGEIAIFRPTSDPDVHFVKRIIGLPGDRIQLREGRLYINDVLVERVELGREEAASVPADHSSDHMYRETLPGGASYLIVETSDDDGRLDNTEEFVVPDEHVFVLGDNRDGSNDSRGSLGFIPLTGLRDKPLFIYWSADKSRIGKVVE